MEHGVTASGEEFTKRRTEAYIQRNCKAAKDLFYEDGKIYALLMSARDYTAVLVRTPYGKKKGVEIYYRFMQRGYALVVQDTRGREESTGKWQPNYYEVEDGDDTLNWIGKREWCDGQDGKGTTEALDLVKDWPAGNGKVMRIDLKGKETAAFMIRTIRLRILSICLKMRLEYQRITRRKKRERIFIFPNSNTKDGFNSEKKQKAAVTIHQDGEYQSYVEVVMY